MICPSCSAANDERAEACFTCGKALFVLTQGTLLDSRYEIVKPLGQGGMSRVYMAHDRVLSEAMAIKVLRSELSWDPLLAARFLSEIKLARKVSHRNVCRIHEYGEDTGVRYISMEFIEGVNLKDHLRGGALPAAEAYDVVLQLAEGLQAVHEHGIIHRDLKTSNIMIDSRGLVKLMDFGIAKHAESETDWATASGGHVVGTPEYMSPEQARGAKLDFRSDIYSLGCVVFEVFTGHAPFRGETPVETLFKHVNELPPLVEASLPRPLVSVLRRALAKKPQERFLSVREFIEALRASRSAADLEHPETQPVAVAVAPETPGPTPYPHLPTPPPETPPRDAGASSPPSIETFTLTRIAQKGPQARASLTPSAGSAPPATRPRRWLWVIPVLAIGGTWAAVRGGMWPGSSRPSSALSPEAWRPASPVLTIPTPALAGTSETPGEGAALGPAPKAESAEEPSRRTASSLAPPSSPAVARTEAGEGLPSRATSRTPVVPFAPASPPSAGHAAISAAGTLTLLVVPAAEVTVDGMSIGAVSLREIPLRAGPHVLRVFHPEYEPLQRKVHIRSGENSRLVLDLAEKGIPKAR